MRARAKHLRLLCLAVVGSLLAACDRPPDPKPPPPNRLTWDDSGTAWDVSVWG